MKFVKCLLILAVCYILLGVGSIYGLYRCIEPQLPDVATLKDVRLQIPMQVYSADGELIAQYSEERRIPVTLSQIPPEMVRAFIAMGDNRFYEHRNVDPVGIFRAANVVLFSGHASQGASTITQQLARNFFLSPERTLMHEIKEVFLTIRTEQLLTKDEILELYLSKVHPGYRAYGVGAATQVYFGETVDQLTLNEMAVIAELPEAPSTSNPLYSVGRAVARRSVMLSWMLDGRYITQRQFDQTRTEAINANCHALEIAFSTPYLSEMVRQETCSHYGESAYEDGYRIYTTITRRMQRAAQQAMRNGMLDCDMRRDCRDPANMLWKVGESVWDNNKTADTPGALPTYGPLPPAAVTNTDPQEVAAMLADGSTVTLSMDGIRWAHPYHSDTQQGSTPHKVTDVLQTGQQIWVRQVGDTWWLIQVSRVNSVLVSINSQNGAIMVLVGGFDFNQNKFNRATQAPRQVGSSIKPFLYIAAIDKGLTPVGMLNDVPISRWDIGAGSNWQPKDSPPQYTGPIRLCQGLGQSKDMVMVYAMRAMGVDYATEYLQRFGFPARDAVHTESLALGSTSFTPMQVARGYTVMANGGFLADPWFISKIEDDQDSVIFEARLKVACPEYDIPMIYGDTRKSNVLEDNDVEDVAISREQQNVSIPIPQLEQANQALVAKTGVQEYALHAINTPLTFLIEGVLNTSIFGGPDRQGTGWRAGHDLQRRGIGGKTGTTNSSKDAWLSGYGLGAVTSVRIGFDGHCRNLGHTTASGTIKDQISGYEGSAKSAQSAWDAYIKAVLEGVPEQSLTPPLDIVTVNVDYSTGQLANGGNNREEYFIKGTQPTQQVVHEVGTAIINNGETRELF